MVDYANPLVVEAAARGKELLAERYERLKGPTRLRADAERIRAKAFALASEYSDDDLERELSGSSSARSQPKLTPIEGGRDRQ